MSTRHVQILESRTFRFNPFRLTGQLGGELDSAGKWSTNLSLKGALSDFTQLEAEIFALDWERSYVHIFHWPWQLRVGQNETVKNLSLPSHFGLSGTYALTPWSFQTSLGLANQKISGYGFVALEHSNLEAALVAGWHENNLFATATTDMESTHSQFSTKLNYQANILSANLDFEHKNLLTEGDLHTDTLKFQVDVSALHSAANMRAEASYDKEPFFFLVGVTLPFAPEASFNWVAEARYQFRPLHSQSANVTFRTSQNQSSLRLDYAQRLSGNWQGRVGLQGAFNDEELTFNASGTLSRGLPYSNSRSHRIFNFSLRKDASFCKD